jgi:nucleotide-binding universal stress UspA family protein
MKILLPLDGSTFSKTALAFIGSRATLIKNEPEVTLLNVQYPVSSRVARAAGSELVLFHHESEAKKVLKPALAALKRSGLKAQTTVIIGSPGLEVARTADSLDIDLIVMGSHGHTGLKNLLFGSVTQSVLASCTRPLLILREDAVPKRDSLKIGVALDGSKLALAALQYVLRFREFFGEAPAITLIHAVPDLQRLVLPGFMGGESVRGLNPEQSAEMQRAAFERVMIPARKLFDGTGMQFSEVQLIDNNPGDAIATFAAKNKLDVVAMGSHGEGVFRSATLGSVASRVAAKFRNALLLIQEK